MLAILVSLACGLFNIPYRLPTAKVAVIVTFRDVFIFNLQTTGTGKSMTTMSVTKAMIASK